MSLRDFPNPEKDTTLLEQVLCLALLVHQGQKDKAGKPYILHPLRVMMAMEENDTDAQIIALLHDTLEDVKASEREELIEELEVLFPPDSPVLEALKILTKMPDADYMDYLEGVAANDLAYTVKKADLKDNMNLSRLPVVTSEDRRRFSKYARDMEKLTEYYKIPSEKRYKN